MNDCILNNDGHLKPDYDILNELGLECMEWNLTSLTKNSAYSFEILLVSSGECTVDFNFETLECTHGSLLFFHCGDMYDIAPKGDGVHIRVITFTDFFMYPFESNTITFLSVNYSNRKYFTQLSEKEFEIVSDIWFKIEQRQKDLSAFNRIYMISAINWILFDNMVIEAGDLREDNKRIVEKIISYVHDSFFRSDFSVKSVADHVCLTPNYTSVLFKKKMGMSIQQFVLKRRLELAYDMLLRTKGTVSDISEKCGFNSFSYFMRAFKKKYGHTPNSVRKKQS